jgi:hypothetical protein
VVFATASGELVMGREDGSVEFWDIQSGKRNDVLRWPRGH